MCASSLPLCPSVQNVLNHESHECCELMVVDRIDGEFGACLIDISDLLAVPSSRDIIATEFRLIRARTGLETRPTAWHVGLVFIGLRRASNVPDTNPPP